MFKIGKKDIVDVIVGDHFFDPADETDDAIDDAAKGADDANTISFGSERELNASRRKHRETAATAKARALGLFKRVDDDNLDADEQDYSYSVTIPASRATLFDLAVRYTSYGTSFRMTSETIGCTYDVLGDPRLRHCCRQDVSNYIRVVYAVNLQHISDFLSRSWGFSLALDSATHQSTSYLDIRIRVFVKEQGTIVCLHGCCLPMFDRHTRDEVMFDMVTNS